MIVSVEDSLTVQLCLTLCQAADTELQKGHTCDLTSIISATTAEMQPSRSLPGVVGPSVLEGWLLQETGTSELRVEAGGPSWCQ